jgi:hypothetical protein
MMSVREDAVRMDMAQREVNVSLTWEQINLLEAAIRVAQSTGDMAEHYAALRTIDTTLAVATVDLFAEAIRRSA